MRERALAVVGAIAFVVVALLLRAHFASDDGGGSSSKGPKRTDLPTIACTPDLADVCDQLAAQGQIANDPPQLDLSDAGQPPEDIDGWITWSPAPAVANFDSTEDPAWGDAIVLGSSPLAVMGSLADLRATCGTKPEWVCVGAAPDDDLSVGIGRPETAEGLARLLPVSRTLAEDDDPETLDRVGLQALLDSPAIGQGTAREMAQKRVTQPGSASLVVGPRPLLEERADSAQGKTLALRVETPSPTARATVVVAPATGTEFDVDDWCDDASKALAAAGVAPCEGKLAANDLAGFAWQVRERVG